MYFSREAKVTYDGDQSGFNGLLALGILCFLVAVGDPCASGGLGFPIV